MQISPKDGPTILQPPTATATNPQADSRARAIEKFMGQSQQHPVPNPTQVAPEEMTAVNPPTKEAAPVQTNSVEEAPEQSEAAPKEVKKSSREEQLSSQYANLARKEKALRARAQAKEAELKAKEASIAAKEAELKAKESSYGNEYIPKSKFSEDPVTALLEAGVSYDQLTQAILNQPQQDPATKVALQGLANELKAIREEQQKSTKAYQENQEMQYNQAIKQIRSDVRQLVVQDPNFETIKATNSINDVVELIEETFKQDGYMMSIEEAAQEVENYLVDEGAKLARLSKIQQRIGVNKAPRAGQTPPKQPVKETKQSTPSKTLTNNMGTSGKLSARDRAILAFKGELKK